MFKFLKTDFFGDPNIGLHGFARDNFCFIGADLSALQKESIEKTLKSKVLQSTIAGTTLVGIFCAGNDNGIILPKITEKDEFEHIKKLFPEKNIIMLESRETALGNLILCNNNGVLISPKLSYFKKEIESALESECAVGSLAGLDLVGSIGIATDKGCLVHRDATEDEMAFVEDLLKVKVDVGTANYGSPFVKAGIIVNSSGCLISRLSSGPELGRIGEVFE